MSPNVPVVLASALIPFIFAMIWFHKSLFGGTNWHAIADIPESKTSPVKPVKLALSLLLNVLLAFGVFQFSIHELSVLGMLGGDVEVLKNSATAMAFLAEYGGHFHTWTHGIAHGIGVTLFFILPALGYVVIFEKKSARYFFVYLGYWLICTILMSIVICVWGALPV